MGEMRRKRIFLGPLILRWFDHRGCAKTRKSQRGAELFSLLPSSEGGRQRYSFLD
jgi:hypothetical protein